MRDSAEAAEDPQGKRSSAVLPTLVVAIIGIVVWRLIGAYSIIHWRLMIGDPGVPAPCDREAIAGVLDRLEVYRLLAVPAGIAAYLAIRGRPRWLGIVAIVLAVLILGAGTPLPENQTKWQIVMETLNIDLERIPIAYDASWEDRDNPSKATYDIANFEVVAPATAP